MYIKLELKAKTKEADRSKERAIIFNLQDVTGRKEANQLVRYIANGVADQGDLFLLQALHNLCEAIGEQNEEVLKSYGGFNLSRDYSLTVEEVSEESYLAYKEASSTSSEVNWLQALLDQHGMTRYRLSKMTGIAESQFAAIIKNNTAMENVKYGQVKLIKDAFAGRLGTYTLPSFQPAEDIYCPKCLRRYFADYGAVLASQVYESERDEEEKLARVSCDYCGKSYVVSIKNNLMYNLYPKDFFKGGK